MRLRSVLVVATFAAFLLLPWPIAAWMLERSRRAQAVEIAERACFQEFGRPAPTTLTPSRDRAVSSSAEWVPARHAYVVKLTSQYLSDSTRWTFFGSPVPFSSSTTVMTFEVTPDGRWGDIGLEMAGSY